MIKLLFQFSASEVSLSERAFPFLNNSNEHSYFVFAACEAFLHSLGWNFLELWTGNRACGIVSSGYKDRKWRPQEVRWSTEEGNLWDRTEAQSFWPKSRLLFHCSAPFPKRKKLLSWILLCCPQAAKVRVVLSEKLEALWNIFPVKLYVLCLIVIKNF